MSFLLQFLLATVVACFSMYVLLEVRSVRKAGKNRGLALARGAVPPAAISDEHLPKVSVLLPVYNEKLVVEKLIDAVCALRYPCEKLDILVLDDSTDETSSIAAARIALHSGRGIPIRLVRRETRIGYKAGNLNFGLTLATGDFIAIFDADCLPPPDFLYTTMPSFQDAEVGFLQTGVEYYNKNASLLTRFQAMEAGHKEDVTVGLSQEGFWASLTGSSCVWRKACIEAIGGISAETITEDVDMGYRAQLHTWKYVFLRNVVSVAELPESMAAFRVQRQRWARGLVHNALRHVQSVFAASMGLMPRLHAISLMFSALLLAAFYVLVLLALPLAFMTMDLGLFFHLCCTVFLLAAAAWAWCNVSAYEAGEGESAPLWQQVRCVVGYVMLFFPLSLYYFSAAVQVFAGIKGGFHRTPKGCGRRHTVHASINTVLLYLEIFSFTYALATLAGSLLEGNYWVTLFSGLAAGGFAITLYCSWSDSRKSGHSVRHVLITGATGTIGRALALEYAAPDMRLTLHGRRADELETVAAHCRQKGAVVSTKVLDLQRREELRQWIADLCYADAPDLIIANAGRNTSIGPTGQGEAFAEVQALVEVNLLSAMAMVDGALPALRKRGSGQIVFISSLAAYYGLPTTPTYCATKAALRTYGDALRGWLHGEGIRVNVVLPGYVASPMCAAMPGPKPFLWQPERAARAIRRGLERNWARISFPFPLNLGVWGLSVLPACLATPIARWLGYGR